MLVLKLKPNATYTLPGTGITIKQGVPPESPSDTIIKLFVFTAYEENGQTSVNFAYNIFNDVNKLTQNTPITSGSIGIPPEIVNVLSNIPTEQAVTNAMEAIRTICYHYMLQLPEFTEWEMAEVTIPDPEPVVIDPLLIP